MTISDELTPPHHSFHSRRPSLEGGTSGKLRSDCLSHKIEATFPQRVLARGPNPQHNSPSKRRRFRSNRDRALVFCQGMIFLRKRIRVGREGKNRLPLFR